MSRFVLYLLPKLFVSSNYLLTIRAIKYEHGVFPLNSFDLLMRIFIGYGVHACLFNAWTPKSNEINLGH